MDRIQSLRVFCAVAETLRFRAAADRFSMSPAMVSKHVTALESHVGARLLLRNTRHVSLTVEGQAYYQRAQSILDELDELDASVGEKATRISGVIRLSAPIWMANARFARILQSFTEAHPDVSFDVDLSRSQVNLVEDSYDLALRVTPKLAPGLIAKPLMPINFGLYAAPAYIAARGAPSTFEEIFDHPLLVYSGGPRLEDQLRTNKRGRTKVQARSLISSENEVLLFHAGKAGMGLVVLPNWLSDSEVESGALQRLLPDSFDVSVRVHAVYSNRRLLPARVRKFLNFLGPDSGRT